MAEVAEAAFSIKLMIIYKKLLPNYMLQAELCIFI